MCNNMYRQVPNGAPPGHYLDIFNCSVLIVTSPPKLPRHPN